MSCTIIFIKGICVCQCPIKRALGLKGLSGDFLRGTGTNGIRNFASLLLYHSCMQ